MLGMRKGFLPCKGQSSESRSSQQEDRLKQEKVLKKPINYEPPPTNFEEFISCFGSCYEEGEEDEEEEEESDADEESREESLFCFMKDLEIFKEICLEEMAIEYEESLGFNVHLESPKPSFPSILQRVVRKYFPQFGTKNVGGNFDSKIKQLEEKISSFKIDINEFQDTVEKLRKKNESLKKEKLQWRELETEYQGLKSRNKELEEIVSDLHGEKKQQIDGDDQSDITVNDSHMEDSEHPTSSSNKKQEIGSKSHHQFPFSNSEKLLSAHRFATFLPYDDEKLVWVKFKQEQKIFVCCKCGKSGHKKSKCNIPTSDINRMGNLSYKLYVQKGSQSYQVRNTSQTRPSFGVNPNKKEVVGSKVENHNIGERNEFVSVVGQNSLHQNVNMAVLENYLGENSSSSPRSNISQDISDDNDQSPLSEKIEQATREFTFTFKARSREQVVDSSLTDHASRKEKKYSGIWKNKKSIQLRSKLEDNCRGEVYHDTRRRTKKNGQRGSAKTKGKRYDIQLGKRNATCDLGSTFVLKTPEKKKSKLERQDKA